MRKVLIMFCIASCLSGANATAYNLGKITGRVVRSGTLTEDDYSEDVIYSIGQYKTWTYIDSYAFVAGESGEASISAWSTSNPTGNGSVSLDVVTSEDEKFLYNVGTRKFSVRAGYSYAIKVKTYLAGGQTYSFTLDLPGASESLSASATGSGSTALSAFSGTRALVYKGRVTTGNALSGILEIKTGKVKNGNCKVVATVTSVGGKKYKSSSQTVSLAAGKLLVASLPVSDLGTLSVTIGADGFSGTLGSYVVSSASVGGALQTGSPNFLLNCNLGSIDGNSLNRAFLPLEEPFSDANGKWKFRKAANIKYSKGVWVGYEDPNRPNLSGLKLSYTSKTGVFKGSFKAYAVTSADKLKKYTFKVNGVVTGGIGYALVTLPGSSDTWSAKLK